MVTNDGATILKSIYLDNAAAKILVGIMHRTLLQSDFMTKWDISKTQDDEVGDGTTSVCVLAGELLREGEKLIQQKIHPQTIIAGMLISLLLYWVGILFSTKAGDLRWMLLESIYSNLHEITLQTKVSLYLFLLALTSTSPYQRFLPLFLYLLCHY